MITNKGMSNKKIHKESPFKLSDVILDHHFIRAVTIHENQEKNIVNHGLNVLAAFIVKFGLQQINKNRKPKLVDIMLKHPDVFRMDNIYMHRKKLEKDPSYQAKEEKIQKYFIDRGAQI